MNVLLPWKYWRYLLGTDSPKNVDKFPRKRASSGGNTMVAPVVEERSALIMPKRELGEGEATDEMLLHH